MLKYRLLRDISARLVAIDAFLPPAVSATELGYLEGVTSAIQTQLDAKAPSAAPVFTGSVTLPASVTTAFPVFVDNAAALTGGLTAGRVYMTAAGAVNVVV